MRGVRLTVTWGVIPRGVASGKGVTLRPFRLLVWEEGHTFLDGSPGERPHASDTFMRQGST